ncbi:MAG: YraN family protein [Clostridia bacterium]|nr:YraN family protein [Clostridia bacterium]
MTNKEFGARGEYLARLFLEKKGYLFIRAGFTTKYGEIDLIMQENDELVFVEVKTRTAESEARFGRGAEKIDREKRDHIRKAARIFMLQEPRLTRGLLPRFDAVELVLEKEGSDRVGVRHTPFAFEA